ncbi:MAG: DUF2231 domain-containing protein [Ramlibacter sp.]
MRTPAQIAGHPIHPMLVTIPIGLWVFSLVCDLVAMRSAAPASWSTASYYAMVGGIIGALAAALPGLVDLLSLEPPIKSTAIKHMALNLTIVVLYVVNAWTRHQGSLSAGLSLGLSIIAIAMLLVSGWLGGKMVYEAGVGVHAQDSVETARTGAWQSRSTTTWRAGAATGDRAMASDASRPSRDTGERPAAGMTEGREPPPRER